jgi:pimeloyl-ACP methyl ester carboxylesterase
MFRLRGAGSTLVALILATAACKETFPSPIPDASAPPPIEANGYTIKRETFVVDGVVPPKNPVSGEATPVELNKTRVVRYRVDSDPPKPARAIIIMMPGFLGGGGSFDALAKAVVRRSAGDEVFEAWAIDRRANFLEDRTGIEAAKAKGDPSIAQKYYFDNVPVDGKTFAGFVTGENAGYASEWGLATTVGDLRNVISVIPQADRAGRVFLLGHSLGASVAEAYAAWDFGTPGYQDLAGLMLVDGVGGKEGDAPSTIDQTQYEQGGGGSLTEPKVGVEKDLRTQKKTLYVLPFLGQKAQVVSEYLALAAVLDPNGIRKDDPQQEDLLAFLLGYRVGTPTDGSPARTKPANITNRAAFGMAFDDPSALLQFTAVNLGAPAGGPLAAYKPLTGDRDLLQPSDPNATYTWTDYDKTQPTENTNLTDFAKSWYAGESCNFGEWYFPQRLQVDVGVATTLNIEDTDFRSAKYGIKAKFGSKIDVPIFGAAFALVKEAKAFDKLKATVSPTIGPSHVGAGKPRSDTSAFRAEVYPTLSHLDGLVGADDTGTEVARFYESVVSFARVNTAPGGVTVPVK